MVVIFNSGIITLMLLTAFGWDFIVPNEKWSRIIDFIYSCFMWYMMWVFANALYKIATAPTFSDMLNHRFTYVVYIVAIFAVVMASINKQIVRSDVNGRELMEANDRILKLQKMSVVKAEQLRLFEVIKSRSFGRLSDEEIEWYVDGHRDISLGADVTDEEIEQLVAFMKERRENYQG
ncbi:TPA: hypothetical protein ACGWER_001771 [Streptococcus agalactiae]|nr:hypothetical protein [Streptococcus agalactiae]HEO2267419.1 hypothetical protein [Streptococcus agalactiae]HEO7770421.1 hypothetical protein [Streptococcus agalactiae]